MSIKFDEASNDFLKSIPASRQRTGQTYAAAMSSFERFLENSDNSGLSPATPLSEYPESVLLNFLLWLDKQGYSAFTQNTYLAGLRRFLLFHHLARNLGTEFDMERARELLGKRKLHYPQHRIPDELPEMVLFYDRQPLPPSDDTKNTRRSRLCLLRDRAIMHTLFDSAGRVSEVADLTRQDVDDGNTNEIIISGKGGKDRWMYLTDETLDYIRAYLTERNDNYLGLFISHGRDAGSLLSRTSLWRIVKLAAKMIGVKNVSPHTFRHWRATQMLNDGVPLETIQELLGHSDIGTTRKVYARSKREKVREAFFKHTPSPQQAALAAAGDDNGQVNHPTPKGGDLKKPQIDQPQPPARKG